MIITPVPGRGWRKLQALVGVPEVLGEQELGVGVTLARHDCERNQLPCELTAAQLDETHVERHRHPRIQVGMSIEECSGCVQSLTSIRGPVAQQIAGLLERCQ